MTTKDLRAAWREQNRERIRAYDRARYAARPAVVKERAAAWRAANPERAAATRAAWRERNRAAINAAARLAGAGTRRWRTHRVTRAAFDAMFAAQGARCAICATDAAKKWTLDHDHATTRVRQILCNRCNLALGLLDDDVDRLRAAADYVAHHSALAALL